MSLSVSKNKSEKQALWTGFASLLLDRTLVLIGLLYILIMVILVWRQAQLEDRLVESAAQEEARRYTEALATFRTLYTREVVEPLRPQNIVVTHDYDQEKYGGKAIPLPATLSMLIGNEMAKQELGGQTALYSGYPFPWRAAEWEQRDQFAKDAWQALTQHPNKPFQRFENRDGRRWLRYATADLMRESCVECHNKYPGTPKTDWKENDVRGVLEVSLPLDSAIAQTDSNLRESIGYTSVIGGLGFLALITVFGRLRRSSRELERHVEERTEELQESEDKYRDLFENARDLIQSVAPDGSFDYVNPAWKTALGYSDADIASLSMFDIIHPDSLAHCQEMFQRVMAGEKLDHIEAKFVTKSGSILVVEGSSSCKFDRCEPVSTRGIFHDITDRKQAEEKLQLQDEELKRTNKELARFNRLTTGREMRVIELKKRINELSNELRKEPPYDLSYAE